MTASPAPLRRGAYAVPQRFGISAILALTTLFACVFAILNGFGASPAFYLYFGTLGVAICLAQMFFGRVPRASSIVAGAILLPFWVFVSARFFEPQTRLAWEVANFILSEPQIVATFSVICGAVIGYLAGALLAGFFLLLDKFQPPAEELAPHDDSTSPAAAMVEQPTK